MDGWVFEVLESTDLASSVGHGDAGHHPRVAVAGQAEGPFVDLGIDLSPDERFAIDPHPFRDAEIDARDRPMHGSRCDWHTLEGPSVREHDGTYHCFYPGGSWQGEGYAVAWASAPTPLGPWTEFTDVSGRLIASVSDHVRGPGHHGIVTTFGGTDMIVHHAWDETLPARQLCIDPLRWTARRNTRLTW